MTKTEFEAMEADTSKSEEQKCRESIVYMYVKYYRRKDAPLTDNDWLHLEKVGKIIDAQEQGKQVIILNTRKR